MSTMLGIALGALLLESWHPPIWAALAYAVPAVVVAWWMLPRVAFGTWCDAERLYWRWGIVHHEIERSVPLADIKGVEVVTMPDTPMRHVRTRDGVELHGGNFTPARNRGVLLHMRDGRRVCLGLPRPEPFAQALRDTLGGLKPHS